MLGVGQGSDQGSHLTSGLFITWAPAAQACSRADYGCESLGAAPVSPKGMSREEGLLSPSPPAPPSPLPRDLVSRLFSSSTSHAFASGRAHTMGSFSYAKTWLLHLNEFSGLPWAPDLVRAEISLVQSLALVSSPLPGPAGALLCQPVLGWSVLNGLARGVTAPVCDLSQILECKHSLR